MARRYVTEGDPSREGGKFNPSHDLTTDLGKWDKDMLPDDVREEHETDKGPGHFVRVDELANEDVRASDALRPDELLEAAEEDADEDVYEGKKDDEGAEHSDRYANQFADVDDDYDLEPHEMALETDSRLKEQKHEAMAEVSGEDSGPRKIGSRKAAISTQKSRVYTIDDLHDQREVAHTKQTPKYKTDRFRQGSIRDLNPDYAWPLQPEGRLQVIAAPELEEKSKGDVEKLDTKIFAESGDLPKPEQQITVALDQKIALGQFNMISTKDLLPGWYGKKDLDERTMQVRKNAENCLANLQSDIYPEVGEAMVDWLAALTKFYKRTNPMRKKVWPEQAIAPEEQAADRLRMLLTWFTDTYNHSLNRPTDRWDSYKYFLRDALFKNAEWIDKGLGDASRLSSEERWEVNDAARVLSHEIDAIVQQKIGFEPRSKKEAA